MAKKSPTQNDPATLAFSAVEDALKDSVFADLGPDLPASDSQPSGPAPGPRLTPRNDRGRVADKQAALSGSVANDDRFQGSRILYGLQSKSSQAPNMLAIIVSAAWLVGVIAVAMIRNGRDFGTAAFFGSNDFIGLIALAVIPVLGFFAIATLLRRAQDLRNAATAVTHAAIRLAEPETTASEKVASVGQAVRREVNALGDGLERALSRAGELEVMIHNEVTALERTYSDNESRMRALIQELASQREAVITNTEKVREAITESHTGLVFDLDMISQRIAGTIVESGGNLTKALESAGNSLNGAFGERTESFVSLIDQRTNNLLTALDDSASRLNITLEDRAGTISGAFENRTLELSSVIDGRLATLQEALDTRANTLSEAIENRTSSLAKLLSQGGITLLDQLRDRGHEVSTALDMIGTRIATDISARTKEAEAIVGAMSKQLDEGVAIQINAMESRLQTAMIELSGALDDTTERARVTLMGAGSQNLTQFDARLDEIAVVIDTRLQSLDGVIGDKGEKLIAALEKNNASFAARANVLEMALDEKSGHFNDIVNQRTREMTETLGQRTKQITDVIGNRSREISDSLEGHAQILADALDGRHQALNDTLQTRTSELSEKLLSRASEINEILAGRTTVLDTNLNQHTAQLGNVLESRLAGLEGTLQQHGNALVAALDQRSQQLASTVGTRSIELSEALNTRTEQLAEVLGTHTAAIAGAIGDRTMELARTIDAQGTTARDKIDASLRSVTDIMADRATAVSALIASKVAEVNDNLGRGIDNAILRIADAETGVTARIDGAASTVGDSARKAADIIETGVNSARKAITDMVDQRLGTLPEAITARADITAERLASLNTAINTALVQSMTDLEAGADRIEETISQRIVAATASITLDVAETADRMDTHVRQALEQIQLAAKSIDEIISVKAVNATDAIESRVGALHNAVSVQTDNLASLVTERTNLLEQMLANHGNVLNQALATNAAEAERLMGETSGRILSDVGVALNKLNESNLLLQQVLDVSTNNLAKLETSVADQTATYSSTVREAITTTEDAGRLVSEHVNALRTSISTMVAEFGTMLGNLNTEAGAIDQAATNLNSASAQSLGLLEDRRSAMDALAQSFTARADEIDDRMRTFAQSIADAVNETERRLLDARSGMEDVLAGTGDQVVARLAEFRTSAGAETEKASDVLRHTQQTMILEMQQALEEATRRFNETAAAMRATAHEVGSELEATRSELARGVMELPEETKASAAAMRRVVAEQIEALAELNAIVRAQPATHDLNERKAPPATRQDSPRAEPIRQEPIRQEPLRQDTPRPEPMRQDPPRPDPVRSEPARVAEVPRAAPAPRPAPAPRLAPVAEAPRQATAAAPKAEDGNGGWLRDVLRNANTPSAPAAAPQQNLTALTDEIARAIEPAALADAWQRYQAGEQNVFTRRIYTLTGQSTYDQVRKRLTADSEFAHNATAYMSEFELLLKRAAAGADPLGETRQYLLSDRGRVYTMLAHAAGRLG
ncbi:MAG: hypothetical protein ABL866_08645 [Devosia sp.]